MRDSDRKYRRVCMAVAAVALTTLCPAQTDHTEILTPCFDEQVTLTSTYNPSQNADVDYRWYCIKNAGDTVPMQQSGQSVNITATRSETYYCEVVTPAITTTNNLMKNGDFETVPPGVHDGSTGPNPPYFTSTYRFAGWHVRQPGDYENRFVMTRDAQYYYSGFLSIKPHGGQWFALFDASTNGDAWRAETANNNPDLKVVAGEEYVFSYWVANPNDNNNPTARLQFYITYLDANMEPIPIGNVLDLKEIKNKGWIQQTVYWTAPYTSNNIAIAVRDLETSSEGNDFCLDDIIFQATSTTQETVLHADTFRIEPQFCCPDYEIPAASKDTVVCPGTLPLVWNGLTFSEEGTQKDTVRTADGLCDSIEISYTLSLAAEVVYTSRDTAVCSSQLPFVWDGLTFEDQGSQHKIIPAANTLCDSIDITYTLSLLVGVEMYGKWDDVIFIPNRDSLFVAYQWYMDNWPIPGATDQFYHNPEGLAGEYYCVMQTVTGGQQMSCPATFDELDRSADHNPGDGPRQVVARRTYRVGAHLHVIVSTFDDQTFTAEKQWIP